MRRVSAFVEECIRRGEGGGVGKGKKDTGYLYKAFMVARVLSLSGLSLMPITVDLSALDGCFDIPI